MGLNFLLTLLVLLLLALPTGFAPDQYASSYFPSIAAFPWVGKVRSLLAVNSALNKILPF